MEIQGSGGQTEKLIKKPSVGGGGEVWIFSGTIHLTKYLLVAIFKALNNSMPQYIQSLFNIRENKKNLRGNNKLVLPVAKTTAYGLKSTSYIAAKAWNALPDNLRSVADFARFRKELRKLRNL